MHAVVIPSSPALLLAKRERIISAGLAHTRTVNIRSNICNEEVTSGRY